MEQYYQEPTPVQYSASGVKKHHYIRKKNGVRLHWHDRMELIRLHKGQMQVGYGENRMQLQAGEIYIVAPKTPHAVKLVSESVEYDVLMFDVRWFYNETEICQKDLRMIFEGRTGFQMTTADGDIRACFDRLFAVCEEPSLEGVALIYQLLHLLLTRALSELSAVPKGDETIRSALEYIEKNYAQELTTEYLAKLYGYSEAHFCRKFKETAWLTPMNYLRIYRLEEAAKLLRQGKGSVSDIALACGFPDPNYFTRCFKKHFGVPPRNFEKAEKRSSF